MRAYLPTFDGAGRTASILQLVLVSLLIAGGCTSTKGVLPRVTVPVLAAPPLPAVYSNVNDYYPDASRRAGEQGRVVVQFSIDASGKATGPIEVEQEQSDNIPRLVAATQMMFHGEKFLVGDTYKRTVTASVIFEIMPCGTLSHDSGVDYKVNLCIPKFDPPPTPPIPEFVHWFEAFDSVLDADEQSLLRSKMRGYAKRANLPALTRRSNTELRVWASHAGREAYAGFVVSNGELRKCSLPANEVGPDAESNKLHCSTQKRRSVGRYFAPLKDLEASNGYSYRCISPSGVEADLNVDIQWVDAGKLYAIHSSDPRNVCLDTPSRLIAQVIKNAGW